MQIPRQWQAANKVNGIDANKVARGSDSRACHWNPGVMEIYLIESFRGSSTHLAQRESN
jgi:hypothetical protein